MKHFFEASELSSQGKVSGKAYLEFLRTPSMSVGIYVLPAGATDQQAAHQQDEIYYVVRGRARMRIGPEDREVVPGSVIFVEAEMEHRFHTIQEELALLVVFAPAEGS